MSVVIGGGGAATTSVNLSCFHLIPSFSSFYLWHSRLGHILSSRSRFLASIWALENFQTCDIFYCNGCKLAKFSTLLFNQNIFVSFSPFNLIYFDIWGLSPITIKEESWYYVSFVDDHTRCCWVYLMKHRFEFFKIYTIFRAFVKTQYSVIIKCFRCTLEEEYTSNKFYELLALDGTIHKTLCIDTPKKNRVAERKYRHIVETAHSLLLFAFVPSESWGGAVFNVISLINTIVSFYISSFSPFKKLHRHALIIPPLEFLVILFRSLSLYRT